MCADPRVAIRQVAEMHLDERLEKSREVLGKQIAVGQQKVSSAYNRLWAEMEAMREAQKKRAEEARLQAEKEGRPVDDGKKCTLSLLLLIRLENLADESGKAQAPDLSNAQARAGAYFSSWGSWASEKRRGWGTKTPASSPPPTDIKRAEDFKREKEATVGGSSPVDVKRRSLFFDAEKDKSDVGTS
jgi:hypothetical protein